MVEIDYQKYGALAAWDSQNCCSSRLHQTRQVPDVRVTDPANQQTGSLSPHSATVAIGMTSSLTGVSPGIGDGAPVTVAAEHRFHPSRPGVP